MLSGKVTQMFMKPDVPPNNASELDLMEREEEGEKTHDGHAAKNPSTDMKFISAMKIHIK